MKSRAASLVLAAVLVLVALFLALDNPEIDDTSRGDNYPCNAPYDTVLNDANNIPGGETPPDSDQIATRCDEAGRERFNLALVVLAAAVLAGGCAFAIAMSRPRSAKKGA